MKSLKVILVVAVVFLSACNGSVAIGIEPTPTGTSAQVPTFTDTPGVHPYSFSHIYPAGSHRHTRSQQYSRAARHPGAQPDTCACLHQHLRPQSIHTELR